MLFYIKRPKLHVATQFSTHKVINKSKVSVQLLNKNLPNYCLNHSIKLIVTVSDKLAPPGECWNSCDSDMKRWFLKIAVKFYLNLKVTQWPWSVKLTLSQHCSPVGSMPIKYTAKITIKMRKFKMLDFSMKIWPWPRGRGQMV